MPVIATKHSRSEYLGAQSSQELWGAEGAKQPRRPANVGAEGAKQPGRPAILGAEGANPSTAACCNICRSRRLGDVAATVLFLCGSGENDVTKAWYTNAVLCPSVEVPCGHAMVVRHSVALPDVAGHPGRTLVNLASSTHERVPASCGLALPCFCSPAAAAPVEDFGSTEEEKQQQRKLRLQSAPPTLRAETGIKCAADCIDCAKALFYYLLRGRQGHSANDGHIDTITYDSSLPQASSEPAAIACGPPHSFEVARRGAASTSPRASRRWRSMRRCLAD